MENFLADATLTNGANAAAHTSLLRQPSDAAAHAESPAQTGSGAQDSIATGSQSPLKGLYAEEDMATKGSDAPEQPRDVFAEIYSRREIAKTLLQHLGGDGHPADLSELEDRVADKLDLPRDPRPGPARSVSYDRPAYLPKSEFPDAALSSWDKDSHDIWAREVLLRHDKIESDDPFAPGYEASRAKPDAPSTTQPQTELEAPSQTAKPEAPSQTPEPQQEQRSLPPVIRDAPPEAEASSLAAETHPPATPPQAPPVPHSQHGIPQNPIRSNPEQRHDDSVQHAPAADPQPAKITGFGAKQRAAAKAFVTGHEKKIWIGAAAVGLGGVVILGASDSSNSSTPTQAGATEQTPGA